MKAYICDQCRGQGTRSDHYDLPPHGWYTFYQVGGPMNQANLCSEACLRAHVQVVTPEPPAAVLTSAPSSLPEPF